MQSRVARQRCTSAAGTNATITHLRVCCTAFTMSRSCASVSMWHVRRTAATHAASALCAEVAASVNAAEQCTVRHHHGVEPPAPSSCAAQHVRNAACHSSRSTGEDGDHTADGAGVGEGDGEGDGPAATDAASRTAAATATAIHAVCCDSRSHANARCAGRVSHTWAATAAAAWDQSAAQA